MIRPLGWGALLTSAVVALAPGCSAPTPACDPAPARTELRAGPLTGNLLLAEAGDAVSARYQARLEGLLELRPGKPAIESGVGVLVVVRLTYDEPSFPPGVPTEMPRVAVRLSPATPSAPRPEQSFVRDTPHVLPRGGSRFSNSLSEACYTPGQAGCCDPGASSCSQVYEVTFERLDGEPYPVVRLEWELSVSVRAIMNPCPSAEPADLRLSVQEVP